MAIKKAMVNHEMLVWSREEAGLTIEAAIEKLGLSDNTKVTALEKLKNWETGHDSPSVAQAKKLASVYRRPMLTFFLKTPPKQIDDVADFRTLGDREVGRLSPELSALVRRVKAKQTEVKELILEEDERANLPFVGRFNNNAKVHDVVDDIRAVLGLSIQEQLQYSNRDALFRLCRKKIEAAGIFVMVQGNLGNHYSTIDVHEFRGIALCDKIAPFIVINSNDAKAARNFTLLHELAHIWIGETGISDFNSFGNDEAALHTDSEKFCNEVAAEFLLPAERLLSEWSDLQDYNLIDAVRQLAGVFAVSRAAVAHRLWKIGLIQSDDWWSLYNIYKAEWTRIAEEQKQRKAPINRWNVTKSNLGDRLVSTVIGALDSGNITYTHAARILGVKTKGIDNLKQMVG